MKWNGCLSSAKQTAQNDRRISQQGRKVRMGLAALTLMGLSLCGLSRPSLCDMHIYLYTPTVAQDVTSQVQMVNGHLYVMTGSPFEIVLDFGYNHVYDIDGLPIGFLYDDSTPDPGSHD